MAKGAKRKTAPGDVATNRQARFSYELLDKVEAGMVLRGTEGGKRIRLGDPVRVSVGRIDTARGRVDLYPVSLS